MEFRLLGPVEVSFDGRVLDVGPPQQRLVLAVLAAEAARPVSVECLIDRVWDEPPEHPRRALQVYVSRIRRLLEAPGLSGRLRVAVVRRAGGYLLDVDPDRVDVHRFQRLIGEAHDRSRPGAERVALLGQALELWRDRPLADLPGLWAQRVGQGWQQQHLDAVVAWALACLDVGDPGAALARLGALVGEYPLVEPVSAAYMRVLYAAGRPAQALEHYTAVRHRLADELGTDPSNELQQLHRQILSADPALAPSAVMSQSGLQLVPRQLPTQPQMFTGRCHELATLERIRDPSTVVISAIDGMAGIGKTALALHLAHKVAGDYPDGQLFMDLHGYTQDVDPTEPGEALHGMLRALGVAGGQIPAGLDERAALCRTLLADRKMLIMLDNAATEAQVAPLLPGGPGCLVLVTSRRQLAGLDNAQTLSLDILAVPDAINLFARTVGEARLRGQPPERLVELVELCGRLPLAIRIAAARMRSHPTWNLSHLVQRLRDRRHLLRELETGQRSITAALDLSYHDLNPGQQRAYRLLGAHPGRDIDAYATAALLQTDFLHAVRTLEQLLETHLLHEPIADRYRFHDLTRAHAAHTETRDEAQTATHQALTRLLDYYTHTAALATDAAYPYDRPRRPPVQSADTPCPDLSTAEAALGWLDTELPNLLAAAQYATNSGRTEHTLHLSALLHRHLCIRGRYRDAETLHQHALQVARGTGDQSAEIDALNSLGRVHRMLDRYNQAVDCHQQALEIADTIEWRSGELNALNGLGHLHRILGRYDRAAALHRRALRLAQATADRSGQLDAVTGLGDVHWLLGRHKRAVYYYERALQIAHAIGDRSGELNALNGLGLVHHLTGHNEKAIGHYERGLQIAQSTGDPCGELNALNGIGHLHRVLGRYQQAADHHRRALQIAQGTGHRIGELYAITGLGHLHRVLRGYEQAAEHYEHGWRIAQTIGDRSAELNPLAGLGRIHLARCRYQQAADCYRQVLALARELGSRNWQFEALQGLGRLHHAIGQPQLALTHHRQALRHATDLAQPEDQARAHDGLAHAHHALNEHEHARRHWQQALDILTDLGTDNTEESQASIPNIRNHLADLNRPTSPQR